MSFVVFYGSTPMNPRVKILSGVLASLFIAYAASAVSATPTPLYGSKSDLQLQVNTTTGDVQLITPLSTGVIISGYEIDSSGGSLVPANINSVSSNTTGWFELATTSKVISEGTLSAVGYSINPSYNLGDIFNTSGSQDLVFQWGDDNNYDYVNAPVTYVSTPEPAALGMLSVGIIGLAITRRRKSKA